MPRTLAKLVSASALAYAPLILLGQVVHGQVDYVPADVMSQTADAIEFQSPDKYPILGQIPEDGPCTVAYGNRCARYCVEIPKGKTVNPQGIVVSLRAHHGTGPYASWTGMCGPDHQSCPMPYHQVWERKFYEEYSLACVWVKNWSDGFSTDVYATVPLTAKPVSRQSDAPR